MKRAAALDNQQRNIVSVMPSNHRLQVLHPQAQNQSGQIKKINAAVCVALLLLGGVAHADDNSAIREANAALSQKDFSTAFPKFLALAQQGNAIAQFNVGAFYLNGQGTQKDPKQAYEWFAKSAAQGNARALKVMESPAAKAYLSAKEAQPQPATVAAPAASESKAIAQPEAKADAPHAEAERSGASAPSDFSLGLSAGRAGKITGINNSTALGVLAGYQINQSFGVELAYHSLYRHANADRFISTLYAGTTGTFDLTSISMVGQYRYGLTSDLFLLGELGIHTSRYRVNCSTASNSWKGNSRGAVVGLKLQYDLGKNISLRGGFDTYTESGGITGRISEGGVALITRF